MLNQDTLNQITWILLVALTALAIWQGLRLLWYWRPGWLLSGRRPTEPVMPAIDSVDSTPGRGMMDVPVEGQINVLGGVPQTGVRPIPASQFGIGRFRNEDTGVLVALDERSVSRRHAVFHADGIGLYYLTDTHSSYGTYIRRGNEFERLNPGQRERLFNGDEIRFGQHVNTRFDLPGDTRAAATQL